MDTIKVNRKDVKMIAHRGLSGLERENTNAAFVAAGNRSYYGIETDVHKTADGQYVIIHNDTTGEVTNGAVDINVLKSDYELIKTVVLPDVDGSTARQDTRIPLLNEYIKICKKYDKKSVLELKSRFSGQHIAEIIEIIKEEDYLENVIFISFYLDNCIAVRELLPDQQIQWLLAEEVSQEMKDVLYKYQLDLDMHYPFLNKEIIDELHANNVKVNCWTCNKKERAEGLIEMGVDFITSNILE